MKLLIVLFACIISVLPSFGQTSYLQTTNGSDFASLVKKLGDNKNNLILQVPDEQLGSKIYLQGDTINVLLLDLGEGKWLCRLHVTKEQVMLVNNYVGQSLSDAEINRRWAVLLKRNIQ